MNSLRNRLIAASCLVLVVFLGLVGGSVDQAYEDAAHRALRDRLQGQIYALLSVAEFRDSGDIGMPEILPEVRFSTPWSGLYAQIADAAGMTVWRSFATPDWGLSFKSGLGPSQFEFQRLETPQGASLLGLSFGLVWQDGSGKLKSHIFSVAEDLEVVESQVEDFRQRLWVWLGLAFFGLLVTLGLVLRWGLSPLRAVAKDLKAIQSGSQGQLRGKYPRELEGLTSSLNSLIVHQQQQLERHRNRLSDLAHSLKTPLSVLGSMLDGKGSSEIRNVQVSEQITQMSSAIDYQLQRAATAGRLGPIHVIQVAPVVDRIMGAMQKVYADKSIKINIQIDSGLVFEGDEGDLLELFGNIIENACKWCRSKISISAGKVSGSDLSSISFCVEDDGPGIAEELVDRVQNRGVRGDERAEGQGIGLAIVSDVIDLYEGSLDIGRSDLGGARISVEI